MRYTPILVVTILAGCSSPCIALCDRAYGIISDTPEEYNLDSWQCWDVDNPYPDFQWVECESWGHWHAGCVHTFLELDAHSSDEEREWRNGFCGKKLLHYIESYSKTPLDPTSDFFM